MQPPSLAPPFSPHTQLHNEPEEFVASLVDDEIHTVDRQSSGCKSFCTVGSPASLHTCTRAVSMPVKGFPPWKRHDSGKNVHLLCFNLQRESERQNVKAKSLFLFFLRKEIYRSKQFFAAVHGAGG